MAKRMGAKTLEINASQFLALIFVGTRCDHANLINGGGTPSGLHLFGHNWGADAGTAGDGKGNHD